MKKLLTTIITLVFAIVLVDAQSQTTSFDVDGIKVIFKPTVKEIINVRMFYRGGVSNYPASQAGIESFALHAATECGTKKYNANEFKDKADKFDVLIGASAAYDYSDIGMECISKYFNEGWDLFADAVVNPVFDENEIQLLRNKLIGKIRSEETDPDKRSDQLILKNAFQGTLYATDPDGSEDVISKLSAADLSAYYHNLLNKNRMFIVVAGKISKEELIAKIKTSFAGLPSKPYTPATYNEPVWNDYKVLVEGRELSTNYINAIMNAPPVNSPDYVPFRVGISALGGSLYSELRTRLNLSYDPGANSVMLQMPYALMYISTTNPKEAIQDMVGELNIVRQNNLTSSGLKHLKSSYITSNYIKQQSSSAITESLGQAEILGGWEISDRLPELIDKVTVGQIKTVMNKYISGLRWSYLGNIDQANDATNAFKTEVK
jgi:zinc protease